MKASELVKQLNKGCEDMAGTYDGMWSFSTDGELYSCPNETRDEAIAEGHAYGRYPFWVGQCRSPIAPEDCFHSYQWIDDVLEHHDYGIDCAENWLNEITKQQKEELETEVAKVIGAWLDRHDLRPRFSVIDEETITEFHS